MGHVLQLQTSFQLLLCSLCFLFPVVSGSGQITIGHVDDFENLSVSGWAEGPVSPNPPVIVDTGGPDGPGDAFLRNASSGGIGAGSMWVMFNQSGNWTGNYTAAGVMRITMDVRVSGGAEVNLRIAFNGTGGTISSTGAITMMPGQEWQNIQFDISTEDFVSTSGGGNIANTLAAVSEIRILHNPQPSYMGEIIAATVDIDNISVEGASANEDILLLLWQVFPNPARDFLHLSLPGNTEPVLIEIFDVMGVSVLRSWLRAPYHLDISHLLHGLYYVCIEDGRAQPVRIGN